VVVEGGRWFGRYRRFSRWRCWPRWLRCWCRQRRRRRQGWLRCWGIGVGKGSVGGGGGGGGGGGLHERHKNIAPPINISISSIPRAMFAHFGRKSRSFILFSCYRYPARFAIPRGSEQAGLELLPIIFRGLWNCKFSFNWFAKNEIESILCACLQNKRVTVDVLIYSTQPTYFLFDQGATRDLHPM